MSRGDPKRLFLVLASRRAFESLAGPIPEAIRPLFRFLKPRQAVRIRAVLPDCRLVISKNVLRPTASRWILEARRLGVPTLLLVDGPLEWSNLARPRPERPPQRAAQPPPQLRSTEPTRTGERRTLFDGLLHDAVASIGASQRDWIARRNQGRGLLHVCYANRRIQTKAAGEREAPTFEFDFLLTTARTPCFDRREADALRSAIEACARALHEAGHRILLRVFDAEIRDQVVAQAPDCEIDSSPDFATALTRVNCVIGTPSSVLLEAMQHGKPTAQLMYRDTPLFYQSGWLLGCNDDWDASLASMKAADPTRMALQAETLRSNLSDNDLYTFLEDVAAGHRLESPRPFDEIDRDRELELLRRWVGLRARLLAPVLRSVLSYRRQNGPSDAPAAFERKG